MNQVVSNFFDFSRLTTSIQGDREENEVSLETVEPRRPVPWYFSRFLKDQYQVTVNYRILQEDRELCAFSPFGEMQLGTIKLKKGVLFQGEEDRPLYERVTIRLPHGLDREHNGIELPPALIQVNVVYDERSLPEIKRFDQRLFGIGLRYAVPTDFRHQLPNGKFMKNLPRSNCA